jgi:hypothetical protein
MKPKHSLRFRIGVFFLIINVPFGYGVGALVAAVAAKRGEPALGAVLGIVIYILSWGMMGLGIWLAGPEGIQLVKDFRKKLFRGKNKPSGHTPPSV